jgi:hypothetical protein
MSGMDLGDVASRCRLYLVAKTSHVGVNVNGLACPLHRPMAHSRQMRGQGFLSGVVLSCHVAVGSGAFFGGCEAPKIGYSVECWPSGYLCYRVLHGVNRFHQGMFILC